MHKGLQILSPFLILGIMATFIPLIVQQAYSMVIVYLVCTAVISLISLLILVNKLSVTNTRNKKDHLPHNPFGILKFVLLHEYIILLAWKDFLRNDYSVTWKKAETTRG